MKPKARCFIHPWNGGAGLPDGGFFMPDQLKNTDEEKPLHGVPLPSRGAVEIKSTAEDLDAIAKTRQALAYLERYRLVLLTNYREFLRLKCIGGKTSSKSARITSCPGLSFTMFT